MLIALTAVAVVIADQLTTDLAISGLKSGPVHLIGPLFLELAFNTGVAFSIGAGLGEPIVVIVVVLVVTCVAFFARSVPSASLAVACGLVLGGAVGNLADRLFRSGGAVVDFVRLGFWPTFNLADASIVCGSLLACFLLLRKAPVQKRPPDAASGQDPRQGP